MKNCSIDFDNSGLEVGRDCYLGCNHRCFMSCAKSLTLADSLGMSYGDKSLSVTELEKKQIDENRHLGSQILASYMQGGHDSMVEDTMLMQSGAGAHPMLLHRERGPAIGFEAIMQQQDDSNDDEKSQASQDTELQLPQGMLAGILGGQPL